MAYGTIIPSLQFRACLERPREGAAALLVALGDRFDASAILLVGEIYTDLEFRYGYRVLVVRSPDLL